MKNKIINKKIFSGANISMKNTFFIKLFLAFVLIAGFSIISTKEVKADVNTPCEVTCSQYSTGGNNITWRVDPVSGSCDNNVKKYYYRVGENGTGNLFFTSATGLQNNVAHTFYTSSSVDNVYVRVTTGNDGSTNWVSCGSGNGSSVTNYSSSLTASCTPNKTSVDIGESVTWNVTASGPYDRYSYSWTGTDNLYGSNSSVTKTYTSEGTKTASVTVKNYKSCNAACAKTITVSCGSVVVNSVPDLSVSCYANPDNIEVGDSTTWIAEVSGGTGSYSYSWSGTNSLFGSSRTIDKTYSTEGTKTATVRVTSGNKTATANCSMSVSETPVDDLTVSCYADDDSIETGDSIKWIAEADGGTGSYSYSWSGTNSLSGSSRTTTKTYNNEGSKYAKIRVTSGSKTAYATCYADVSDNNSNDDLSVSCYADDDSIETGDSIKWIAEADGGSGSYRYSWSGTNSLSGSSRTVTKTYNTEGSKTAKVKVTSNGHTEYATCYADVSDNNQVLSYTNSMPLLSSVYLSDIPYTGVGDNIKIALFISIFALWSIFLAYYLLKKRLSNKEIIISESVNNDVRDSSLEIQNVFEEKKESDKKAIQDIEDYARMNKIILSSSASEKILKLSSLGKAKANEIIKSLSIGDWKAISEEDINN